MEYTIVFTRSARRELQRLLQSIASRILRRIEGLAQDPRPRGSTKLRGTEDTWRIRSGDYRVVYRVEDAGQLVDVMAVRHRKDAYRP